jgi:hypothetical protein
VGYTGSVALRLARGKGRNDTRADRTATRWIAFDDDVFVSKAYGGAMS